MVAGFDRYFQIAPCFRDEDAARRPLARRILPARFRDELRDSRGRVPGDRAVLAGVFEEFANGKSVTPAGSFARIPYREAMLKYGSDKPDLRNPILISDVSSHFEGSGFGLFANIVGAAEWFEQSRRRTPPRRAASSSTR
jgi:aspartyl-tRNA synthetase